VRAELLVRTKSLAVRISIAREHVADRLRGDLRELESRLALGGRSVSIVVASVPLEEARVRSSLSEIRYLREHHVMDLAG
jgi:hypothetical protein